jgi:predicted nuclease of predicted toxin-antitoxin system
VRLLLDANLSPRIAKALVESGHDAVHVFDLGLADASDVVILQRRRRASCRRVQRH